MKDQHSDNNQVKSSSLGYSIFNGSLKHISSNKKTLINTINQYSYCLAEKDTEFKTALQNSDILLPDGIAIVAAVRLLEGQKITKIAGADLHHHLLIRLNKEAGKCFYLGSSANTLQKIKDRLSVEFPTVQVRTFSPSYKAEFSESENAEMIGAVNDFAPDVLFIGMTAPKQEKWAHAYKEQLNAQIICSIGAVFDFYAGTVERPNAIWINLGLEWFIRLLKEPRRMWKRYLYYGPVFIYLVMREKWKRIFNFNPIKN
jgi:N-acetylglucosaminyldiphosphoundecaprenol N-acetyl-beta-D-mannosaminyltransferase